MVQHLSYILPHEEEEAKIIVSDLLGFNPPNMTDNYMAVKIFVRDEDIVVTTIDGKKVSICIPQEVSVRDAFRSCAALVLSQGPECYKSERFLSSGPWCKVGDWICIPRNEGTQINYRDIPMQIIKEDQLYCILESPNHINKLIE